MEASVCGFGKRSVTIAWLACASLLLAAPAIAQRRNYNLYTDPDRRFSVEFPDDWDWMNISPSGESIAVFVRKNREAAVVVERSRLSVKLGKDQITEVFAEVEAARLKESQPRATDVVSKIVTEQGKRLILIDYSRPGLKGIRERVRQYSFPVAQDVYRITCTAIREVFPRYEEIFAIVASSLKAAGELPPEK
jgi:hypothetical protein